jgi:uncharacterized protein
MKRLMATVIVMLIVSALLAILAVLPQRAFAASFDCHHDTGQVERTICNNDELSAMDDEMAYLYFKISNNLGRHGARELLDQQRHWLDQWNECGTNAECVRILYKGRLKAFHDVLD